MTFKPRQPRITLSPLHRLSFVRNLSGRKLTATLGNISRSGMGLLRNQMSADAGEIFEGELKISERSYATSAEVKFCSDSVIGCQFTSNLDEIGFAVRDYFKVEICALNLNRVDPKFLKAEPVGTPAWYSDGGANEIYLISDSNGILRFHIWFLGNYIEGARGEPLRAGLVLEDSMDESVRQKGSSLLQMSNDGISQVLFLGSQLIDSTSAMPKELQKALQDLLRG